MNFLIIPSEGFTDYLVKKAKNFGGPKSKINTLEKTNFQIPDLTAIFVIQGERRSAEAINQQRRARDLSELFIVEVPYPAVKRRTVRHPVRARISQLLEVGPLYGYAIYKKYTEQFGAISLRLIYYHLARGVKDGIFTMKQIEETSGEYSWGNQSMRKYYELNQS